MDGILGVRETRECGGVGVEREACLVSGLGLLMIECAGNTVGDILQVRGGREGDRGLAVIASPPHACLMPFFPTAGALFVCPANRHLDLTFPSCPASQVKVNRPADLPFPSSLALPFPPLNLLLCGCPPLRPMWTALLTPPPPASLTLPSPLLTVIQFKKTSPSPPPSPTGDAASGHT